MKILIGNDNPGAHYYQRLGWANALSAANHQVVMWDMNSKPAYDIFDEFSPDIFIGQTYTLSNALVDIIKHNPHINVILKAADWGEYEEIIDKKEYPILFASNEEKDKVAELCEETNNLKYLFIHYHPDYIEKTHGYWTNNFKVPVYSDLNAADTFVYTQGKSFPVLTSDITFVGGYWPYKARVLDPYLVSICKNTKLNIKLFGNNTWPTYHYCGIINDELAKHVCKSAKICPSLHEPHSQKFGFDIVERPFKLLANECFVISDYVEGLEKLFPNQEIIFAKNPDDFYNKIVFYLNNPVERAKIANRGYRKVISEHTYFDRIKDMFIRLGHNHHADHMQEVKNQFLCKL